MAYATAEVDTIGGFGVVEPKCIGCGKPLVIENAWMADGCPCNSGLGVNSMNETRWRLLIELQQRQARELEAANKLLTETMEALKAADEERYKETEEANHEAEKWRSEGDMYGWNFHIGRAGGTNAASIIFYRVRRMLEDKLKKSK